MSEENRIARIEEKVYEKSAEDSGTYDYGEYVRAAKGIFKEMEAGKDLENILESAKYSEKLKTVLRAEIPRLVEKLKEEKLWNYKGGE